ACRSQGAGAHGRPHAVLQLRVGDALPPSRLLASDLGVSRGVVVEAYAQLTAEGWLTGRPGAGTCVARGALPAPPAVVDPAPAAPRFDFRPGHPDVTSFPRGAWLRAVADAVRRAPASRLLYPPEAGLLELRSAL